MTKKEGEDIPYGKQWIDDDDIQAVVETLKSPYIARGPKAEEFERSLCSVTGAKYAVVVNSGTSALHLACLVAGVTVGDEVITSPITFVASANCAAYCGATPLFVDIESTTYCIDPKALEKRITAKTKAVIPVDFAGQSADMEEIKNIVSKAEKKYETKIWIIEDACHVLDSRYKKNQVGACTFSDIVVMSFHPVKHITTGEGGVLFTNSEEIYRRLLLLRAHGITRDPLLMGTNLGYWYYEQVDLGYNFFMTEFQCALGMSQLKKLPRFAQRRREIVSMYNKAFAKLSPLCKIPIESTHNDSTFHLYVLRVDFERIGMERTALMLRLKERGIQTQVHYIPVHTQPYYQKHFGTQWGDYPNAESYYAQALTLPLYPRMNDQDVTRVINAVKEIITMHSSH